MEKKEILMDVLNNKNPVLFLGAGFSLNVKNKKGKLIPSAAQLSRELYDKFLEKNLTTEELKKLFPSEEKIEDLIHVCTVMDLQKKSHERDAYLTERFSGCRCDKSDYHMSLREYPWQTIFSLNIDDLVENIYENSIHVQLLGGEKSSLNGPVFIKLHGSVTHPQYGYVFSEKEYQRNLSQDSWAINCFGTEFYRNDIIFLGTEFQENDLRSIINKFSDAGAITKAHNYFFVTPEIHDGKLEMEIKGNSNYHHIKMTTEEFFHFICKDIAAKNTARKRMRNYGAIFLDEQKKEYKPSYAEAGQLYQGSLPQFKDFIGDWDIRYPNCDRWVEEIAESVAHQVVALYGEPYSGKSCVAMRFAMDLFNRGFFVFSFSLRSDLDAKQYAYLILEYLKTLPEETRCVIHAENMAHFYPNIKFVMDKCPKNIKQLIFLTTADKETHVIKKYIFDNVSGFRQYHITYKVNTKYANNIYDKLSEKSHLNNLLKYAESRGDCVQFLKKIDDIIDILFVSQEGRHFIEHFAAWIQQTGDSIINKKAFEVLCFLGELGIYDMPVFCFRQIVEAMGLNISYDEFYSQYKDYLQIDKDVQKIRCLRIIKSQVLKGLSEKDKFEIIYSVAKYYAPNLSERAQTTAARIFQTVIKVKRLSGKNLLTDERILELLVKLEDKAKHLSYYWIQRGIANRNLDHFEEANNAFNEAVRVREFETYNVKHARAKNYMTWGIWSIANKKEDLLQLFEKGKSMMRDLIKDSPRNYFAYSIHSYTDMIIKYYQAANDKPDRAEVNFIIEGLNKISRGEDDNYSNQIINAFKKFCLKNKIDASDLKDCRGEEDEMFVDVDDLGNE